MVEILYAISSPYPLSGSSLSLILCQPEVPVCLFLLGLVCYLHWYQCECLLGLLVSVQVDCDVQA